MHIITSRCVILAILLTLCLPYVSAVYDKLEKARGMAKEMVVEAGEAASAIVSFGGEILEAASGVNPADAQDMADWDWEEMSKLPERMMNNDAVEMDGRVFIVGGYGANYLGKTFEYFPETDTYEELASMKIPRAGLRLAKVGGKIYAVAGENGPVLSSVEVYDSILNKWDDEANLPKASINGQVESVDEWIYAMGGSTGPGFFPDCWAYNTITKEWEDKSPLPSPTSDAGSVVWERERKIILTGGIINWATSDQTLEYDIDSDSWDTLEPMPNPRFGHAAFIEGDLLYVIGGYGLNRTTDEVGPLNIMDVMDLKTGKGLDSFEMPFVKTVFSFVKYEDGIFIFGGSNDWNFLVWPPPGGITDSVWKATLFSVNVTAHGRLRKTWGWIKTSG